MDKCGKGNRLRGQLSRGLIRKCWAEENGPLRTPAGHFVCCGAARQTRHSLRVQNRRMLELTDRGQSGPLLTRLLLTQHPLAHAECLLLWCSASHRSSHPSASILPEPQPNIRCSLIRQFRRRHRCYSTFSFESLHISVHNSTEKLQIRTKRKFARLKKVGWSSNSG